MLIVNQVEKDYFAHNPTIRLYLTKANTLLERLQRYEIKQI